MMRDSLGTRTITGLNTWLYRTFVKGRSVEADITDYRSGRPIRVYCSSPDFGVQRFVLGTDQLANKPGYLHLVLGQQMSWKAMASGEVVPFRPSGPLMPYVDSSTRGVVMARMAKRMGTFTFETYEGTHRITIPKIDAPLVAEALARG